MVIFSDCALLGKGFFDLAEGALVERVGCRVDCVQIGQETMRRDFFADVFAKGFRHVSVAVFEEVAYVFHKSDTGFAECVGEFDFGDVHSFIFFLFEFGCKDYFSSSASFLRSLPM